VAALWLIAANCLPKAYNAASRGRIESVSRVRCVVFIVCGAYALVGVLFAFREHTILQLLFAISLLALVGSFIASVIHVFRSWSQLRWRTLLPLATCGLVLVASTDVGRYVRDAYFRSQIPRLEAAAKTYLESGQMPAISWSGSQVTATKVGDTNATVIFWWGGGFPVKHTVLVYCSADDPKSYFRDEGWRRGYALQDHWWVVKD
jgi:hypothetical protein